MRGAINIDDINELLNREAPFLEVKDNGLVEDQSGDHAYHLVIKGANKHSAVTLLQELLGIKKEESIGLGDSLSDLSLVSTVANFYLMRNGLVHTPDMLDKFRKSLEPNFPPAEIEQIIERIQVTDAEAGLGWAEVVNNILTSNKA